MTFDDLIFKAHDIDGKHAKCFFNNGYGASVIQTSFSYTSGPDEYELAILKGEEDNHQLCYDTDLTDDVLGHLSEEDVTKYLGLIESLTR